MLAALDAAPLDVTPVELIPVPLAPPPTPPADTVLSLSFLSSRSLSLRSVVRVEVDGMGALSDRSRSLSRSLIVSLLDGAPDVVGVVFALVDDNDIGIGIAIGHSHVG